jgi:ubiquinone/menaquinone biosynthesis C-methylase UbiE
MTKYTKDNVKEAVSREKAYHEDFFKEAYRSHAVFNFQLPRIWIEKAKKPSSIPLDYWEYSFHLLGDLDGKKVVEVGCGDGWITTCLASTGADVYAFDISRNGCKLTKDKLKAHGLTPGFVGVMDAHAIALKDSSIDAVFIAGVLHHLDIDKVSNEIHRILKNGGIFVCYEPLNYGPLMWKIREIWLYLNGKKEYTWTQDEDPLQDNDLDPFRENFKETYLRRFNFIAKTNRLKKRFGLLANTLRWADYILLSVFPFFRRYCTCIVCRFIK